MKIKPILTTQANLSCRHPFDIYSYTKQQVGPLKEHPSSGNKFSCLNLKRKCIESMYVLIRMFLYAILHNL